MQEQDPKFKKEILEKSSIYVFLQTFVISKKVVDDQISISVFNVIRQSIILRSEVNLLSNSYSKQQLQDWF